MISKKAILRNILIIILFSLLPSCRYSPWEINPDCEKNMIAKNLAKLAALETRMSGQTSFKVALVGDPQRHPRGMQKAIERIAGRDDIAFVIILGDLADTGLSMEFEWVCKNLSKLDIPFIPVVGNHDVLSFGKEIWKEIFGPFDYSFTFMGTKFIVYNDNAYEFADVPDIPDLDWMKREAAVGKEESRYHTIGVSHIPPKIDVHTQDEIFEFRQFLFDKGFDYTVHGHLHRFIYFYDEFNTGHYVVSDTVGEEYGIMTVHQHTVEFENCSPECVLADAQ
jgi:predicted phosphodiesterase